MSFVRFEPRPGAIRMTTDTEEHGFLCAGEFDKGGVWFLAAGLTPSAIVHPQAGLISRRDIRVTEVGYRLWHVDVLYDAKAGTQQTGSVRFSFTTTGATNHRQYSRDNPAVFWDEAYFSPTPDMPPPPFPGKHKKLVGVRKRGSQITVDGYDAVVPSLKMTYSLRNPAGVVNEALAREIARATGSINEDEFRGFLPGELLLLGSDGLDGSDAEAEANFHFQAEENILAEDEFSIGGIVNIVKDGHQLLWVEYAEDESDDSPVATPIAAWIEDIYPKRQFGTLFPFLAGGG